MKYGLINEEHFQLAIAEVTRVLGSGSNNNAAQFAEETMRAETNYAKATDSSIYGQGAGILQFDKIRLEDIKMRIRRNNLELCQREWGIDVSRVELRELDFNPFLSLILWRLAMLKIPAAIPTTLNGRAHYWKDHWNSSEGAGSVNHYTVMND